MHTKRLLVVLGMSLGLMGVLLSSLPMARAAPTGANLFAVPNPSGLLPLCTQSDPCRLQAAVNKAASGDTIYIAGGTYTSTGSAVLTLTKSITLYGGWNGAASGAIVRNPAHYKSILNGEDARRVIYSDVKNEITATLDGLFITDGRSANGGGLYADGPHLTISNCEVYANTAIGDTSDGSGAGLYLINARRSSLINNRIHDNHADQVGGGLRVIQSDQLTLSRNRIYSNTTGSLSGGGVYVEDSDSVTMSDNQIYLNTAARHAGGLLVLGGDNVTLTGNAIYSNTAAWRGGGLGSWAVDLTLSDNVFSGNLADTGDATDAEGGGAYVISGTLHVISSTFVDNQTMCTGCPHRLGGGLRITETLIVTIENSLFQDNSAWWGGGLLFEGNPGTITPVVRLQGSTFNHNLGAYGGGARLSYAQAQIVDCTFKDHPSGQRGAAVLFETGTLDMQRSRLIGNRGSHHGLALSIDAASFTLSNNIIANNASSMSTPRAVIYLSQGSHGAVLHNTIARNTGAGGAYGIYNLASGGTVIFYNNIIVSHTVGITASSNTTNVVDRALWGVGDWANGLNWGGSGNFYVTNNVHGDPHFVNAVQGDYHLGPGSAAIDRGINLSIWTDVDGDPRPIGLPDLGADEFGTQVLLPSIVKQ